MLTLIPDAGALFGGRFSDNEACPLRERRVLRKVKSKFYIVVHPSEIRSMY